MTIALSSDFLLAFSNVQKSHQKQVREFIERFRERPDAPGMNYEVIQSAKGKDLYSVRINQSLSGCGIPPVEFIRLRPLLGGSPR